MTTFTPEMETGARAIAEVRERYAIISSGKRNDCHVLKTGSDQTFHSGTRVQCQAWIDREMARACVLALLPVSDRVDEVMAEASFLHRPGQFEAAIRAIAAGGE